MNNNVQYIRTCSIWRALEVVGDKPTLLIMESYWLGARRFTEFKSHTGLLKTVISDRLRKLIDADCLEKVQYSDRPKRFEYRATAKFLDVYPVALCMLHWEKNWGEREGKMAISLTHKKCGGKADPSPACGTCHKDIDAREIDWANGPGLGMMKATYGRRRSSSNPTTQTALFDNIAEIIGDRWSALIIRSLFTGLNKFQEIQDDSAIASNVLTERLAVLIDKGIIEKFNIPERRHSRYKLTDKGRDIYPILIALMNWGDRWYPSPKGSPLLLSHKTCNSDLVLELKCSTCGKSVTFTDITFDVELTKPANTIGLPAVPRI